MFDNHVKDAVSATQSQLIHMTGCFYSLRTSGEIFRGAAAMWSNTEFKFPDDVAYDDQAEFALYRQAVEG